MEKPPGLVWLGIQKGKQESPERKTQRQVFRQGSLETFTARSPRNSGETGVGILILLIFCHVYGSMKKKKKAGRSGGKAYFGEDHRGVSPTNFGSSPSQYICYGILEEKSRAYSYYCCFFHCRHHLNTLITTGTTTRTTSLPLAALCCCALCIQSLQSCLTLCDPKDYSVHQAPLSMGFSRQEYWSGYCQALP